MKRIVAKPAWDDEKKPSIVWRPSGRGRTNKGKIMEAKPGREDKKKHHGGNRMEAERAREGKEDITRAKEGRPMPRPRRITAPCQSLVHCRESELDHRCSERSNKRKRYLSTPSSLTAYLPFHTDRGLHLVRLLPKGRQHDICTVLRRRRDRACQSRGGGTAAQTRPSGSEIPPHPPVRLVMPGKKEETKNKTKKQKSWINNPKIFF